ncbi:hypothetical protein PROFUN_14373 [Planoprotostelium fungivorum]|uniref:Uncharacterized protein n=1 Tax=Planoprotostelium fungivorum TaxID=1890364 RepID=A0A2P6N0E7_9EUKA|nr:hypothetical protein PROFUN_14373 [Planoprotostelium fungivorum]
MDHTQAQISSFGYDLLFQMHQAGGDKVSDFPFVRDIAETALDATEKLYNTLTGPNDWMDHAVFTKMKRDCKERVQQHVAEKTRLECLQKFLSIGCNDEGAGGQSPLKSCSYPSDVAPDNLNIVKQEPFGRVWRIINTRAWNTYHFMEHPENSPSLLLQPEILL